MKDFCIKAPGNDYVGDLVHDLSNFLKRWGMNIKYYNFNTWKYYGLKNGVAHSSFFSWGEKMNEDTFRAHKNYLDERYGTVNDWSVWISNPWQRLRIIREFCELHNRTAPNLFGGVYMGIKNGEAKFHNAIRFGIPYTFEKLTKHIEDIKQYRKDQEEISKAISEGNWSIQINYEGTKSNFLSYLSNTYDNLVGFEGLISYIVPQSRWDEVTNGLYFGFEFNQFKISSKPFGKVLKELPNENT